MSESNLHEQIAERIARRDRTRYQPAKGPDVQASHRVTEVGVDPAKVKEEMHQVARYKGKSRYIAGPADFVKAALKNTQGTGIGVRDRYGNIVKRARRTR